MNVGGASPDGDINNLNQLLRRISLSDQRAFTELYASTRNKMRKTALAVCGPSSDIDDILQVAYIKIWRSSVLFDPNRASPITWMCTILRNTAIDTLRIKKPLQADLEEALALPNPTDPSTEDHFDYEAAAPIAIKALGKLPEDQRTLIVLAYLRGDSRLMLSRRFGVPVSTVKTWLRRTLMSLRKDCATATSLPV